MPTSTHNLGLLVGGALLAAYGTAKLREGDRIGGVNMGGARAVQLAGAAMVGFTLIQSKDTTGRVLSGGVLAALAITEMTAKKKSRTAVGWINPPHPIEVMPTFAVNGARAEQARSVLYDYYRDDNLRNWFDKGEVKAAFNVKELPDYDRSAIVAAYENKSDPVWQKLGRDPATSWAELNRNVDLAIGKRKKLGALPKASYDKDPIIIYYYDDDRMKKVEYARATLAAMLNPNNHYYWRDPSVKTYETQDPKAVSAAQKDPSKPGDRDGWGGEGFNWNKDVVGQISTIVQTTLQLIGVAMQATGYLAAVGSAITQASPYIGTLAGIVDDAFQGNDNSKAVGAIAKIILEVANKGLGEAVGVEIPPAGMKLLGTSVDMIGKQIAAGQQQHLDYTGIWTNITSKAKSFHKIGDAEAHAIQKILGENSAGSMFGQGYLAGKYADLPTIDAISKMFNNQGNANVWMLGAGLGQLALKQQSVGAKAAPKVAARAPTARPATHAAHGWGYPYAREYAWYDDDDEYVTGQTSLAPPPNDSGCPFGSWWDPFARTCRTAAAPPMPPKPQPMPGPPAPMPLPVSPGMPTPAVSGWLYYPA